MRCHHLYIGTLEQSTQTTGYDTRTYTTITFRSHKITCRNGEDERTLKHPHPKTSRVRTLKESSSDKGTQSEVLHTLQHLHATYEIPGSQALVGTDEL
jgi:hypothetical protein